LISKGRERQRKERDLGKRRGVLRIERERERKSKHPKAQGTRVKKKEKNQKVSRRGSRYPTQKGKKKEVGDIVINVLSIYLFIYLVISSVCSSRILLYAIPYNILAILLRKMYSNYFKVGTRWGILGLTAGIHG
jgi:Flp pilus assembly protein TadB